MKLSLAIVSLILICTVVPPVICAGQTDEVSPPPVARTASPAPAAAAGSAIAPPAAKDSAAAATQSPSGVKSSGAASDSKRYVIGPLDVLVIKVWGQAQLSGAVDVNTDGMISMPLIGEVKADGLTSQQLKEQIAKRLGDFLNNPEVTVDVAKVNSKRYFVYGGVLRPGEFPLIEKTTIMDAISLVGGFKDFAKPSKIRVQRGTQTFYFNFKDFSKGKNMDKNVNIELQNGDRIYVPE